MFFFFFNELYNITEIQKAFKNICLDKMLSDGYFDMSIYIFARVRKDDMLSKLVLGNSRYAILYKNSYPTEEKAVNFWEQYFIKENKDSGNTKNDIELSYIESVAIVNWIYRVLKNSSKRVEFTKALFKNIKELHNISNSIKFSRGVVFNKEKVEINFISSISALSSIISSCKIAGKQLFFRGHANPNYILLPSVMRAKSWKNNESIMYNELIINCPEDFEKCHTHLEKLVEMQHYGLPTRLLDITRNPLVALYFACDGQFDCYGEIVLISADIQSIKYPQSDTVSILASLPLFSDDKQMKFYNLAIESSINDEIFNKRVSRLLHEVRLEKPAFQAEIRKNDLLNSFIVYALKNNNRIVKQDGAFILCGLLNESNSLNRFRYRKEGKIVILLVDNKEKILKQLENFSINHATLFPEIECVSEYIKDKFHKYN